MAEFPFLMKMDLEGVAISSGSACSSGALEDSHVLEAIGLRKEDLNSSFRISMGRYTTKEDLDYFLEKLETTLEGVR